MGRKGIDDLKSTIPYDGDPNWPVFSPAFDITEEEYKADKQGYVAKVTIQNNEYIKKLKEEGVYGQEYYVHFNFMIHPDFEMTNTGYVKSENSILLPRCHGEDLKTPTLRLDYDEE